MAIWREYAPSQRTVIGEVGTVSTDEFSREAEDKNCQVKPCAQAKFLLANPFLTCQHELGLSPPEKSGMCGGGRERWICLSKVIDGYTWNKSILGSLGESQLL